MDSISFDEYIDAWIHSSLQFQPSQPRRVLKKLKNPIINSYLAMSCARITSPTMLLAQGISDHNNSVMTGMLEKEK